MVTAEPSPLVVVTSAVTEAAEAELLMSTLTEISVDTPARRGQVTPRSLHTSFSTDMMGKAPRRMSKVKVAPSVIATVGVASTVIVSVLPGTTRSSEKVTEEILRPSVFPEHTENEVAEADPTAIRARAEVSFMAIAQ